MVKIRFFRGYKPILTANRLYSSGSGLSRDFVCQNAQSCLQLRIVRIFELAIVKLRVGFVVIFDFHVRRHAEIGEAAPLRRVVFADGNVQKRAVRELEAVWKLPLPQVFSPTTSAQPYSCSAAAKNSAAE